MNDMKKKIVLKVRMNCEECRSKAMKAAASVDGVNSVAIEGEGKDEVVVMGEGIDAVYLTKVLRKKVGYTVLVSVAEDKPKEEKPKPEPPKEKKEKQPEPLAWET